MKRTHLGIGFGALVLGALGALGACSTTITGDGDSGGGGNTSTGATTPISAGTGGASGGSISDGGAGNGTEPPRPGAMNPGNGSGVVFAISKLFLGNTDRNGVSDTSDGWKHYGFDVDHQITNCSGNGCAEVTDHCRPANGGNPAFIYPDGDDGIDNSFGANIVPILLGVQSEDSVQIDKAIAGGRWTLLVDIEGLGSESEYSPLVSRLYTGAKLGHVPRFDGTDAWPVRPESLTDTSDISTSKEIFSNSYVIGNTWVSGVGEISMPLDSTTVAGFSLDIHHAQVAFRMSADHTSATNGTISGVIPITELVAEFRGYLGAVDESLCEGGTADSIAAQIEQAADIMEDGSAGRPDETCNAISIGLGFNAARVTLGGVGEATPPPHACN